MSAKELARVDEPRTQKDFRASANHYMTKAISFTRMGCYRGAARYATRSKNAYNALHEMNEDETANAGMMKELARAARHKAAWEKVNKWSLEEMVNLIIRTMPREPNPNKIT